MNETLKRFTQESLFNATSALLSKLNISFDRETAQPIDVTELYEPPVPKYLTDALQHIQNAYFIGIVNDLSLQGNKSEDRLEDALARMKERGDKYDGMFVFACDAKPDADLTRSDAAALTRGFNRLARANPVILVIRQNNLISLATSKRMDYTQQWRQESGERVGQVNILRNINCDAPHRGHINILNSLGDKQFTTFEGLYNHWLTTFSNELLTKKFYTELSDWYAWAVKVCRFPNDLNTREDDDKFNHEACIRLITRLIFVWFLKEKELIPEEFFDQDYIRENLISGFAPTGHKTAHYDPEQSKYYRLILQNLFFAMLNRPIVAEGKTTPNNRRFMKETFQGKNPDFNINNIMRYKKDFAEGGADKFLKLANKSVPFLNGGLFECLDNKSRKMYYDGFSEKQESLEQLFLPDHLFFGTEDGYKVDLSKWYGDKRKKNATVRGLIDILKRYSFTIEENTPLDQEVSLDPELLGKVFENLLAAYNPETQKSARKQTGSYYTPREIVQYMVDESLVAHLKRVCGDDLEPKYRDLLSYCSDDVELTEEQRCGIMSAIYNCRVLDPACGSGAFPMGILQQMVHVLKRIDPSNEMWNKMIMDIALEETRKELEKVATGTEKERQKVEENRKARLDDIESAFNRRINDPDYARKLYLIEHCIYGVDIQPIATQISKLRFFISLVVDQNPTKDPKTNFGIRPLPNLESKFVTANTLIPLDRSRSLFTSTDDTRFYEEMLHDLNHRIFLAKRNIDKQDLQTQMINVRRMMAQTLESHEIIGGDGYIQLTEWDMFDQNASAPFFDPEWMFGVKDGFDVVIGNPPYVVTKKGTYKNYEWNTDLYKMFMEVAFKKFMTKDAVISFITPKFYLLNKEDKNIRDYIMDSVNTLQLALCNPFDAVTENVITIATNTNPSNDRLLNYKYNPDISLFENQPELTKDYCKGYLYHEIVLGNDSTIKSLLTTMLSGATLLKNVCTSKRGAEVSKDFLRESDGGMKALIGGDIKRYSINWDNTFLPTNHKEYKRLSSFFNPNLILLRRVDTCLEATISQEGTYAFNKNVYGLAINECTGYSALFILGWLNSKAVDFFYKKRFSTKKDDAFPEIQSYLFDQLPIPKANDAEKIMMEKLVGKALKYSDVSKDSLDEQIDMLVYHLYGLTYDKVLVIDSNTSITRDKYESFCAIK